ncbi:MAG: energy transducer TonB [Bacteroidetes bacterium]|nr:energy transducer TonB [Bacteroidota bacterium]
MRTLIIALLVLQSVGAVSQVTDEEVIITCECIFDWSESYPMFPGGEDSLQSFLKTNSVYPQEAFENKEQGTVYVRFLVNSDGSIRDAKIHKSVSPSLDAEALRIVNSMPKWIPGEQAGKRIRVRYELPISFRLI